ncbi:VOC family protein [Pendulispora rubella]|uniref:VOC family protein n=1 Tax=Pendulispora rubella TaxID=2741070 RepID=A0ABZ2LCV3_9BACT
MTAHIDHVTAVVGDTEAATHALACVTGAGPCAEVNSARMSVRTFLAGPVAIELTTSTSQGPVRDFYDAHGPIFHHVAFRVDDLDERMTALAARGLPTLGAPIDTAPGVREVFLDPKHTGGLMIQLVERRSEGHQPLDPEAIERLAGSTASST